MGKKGLDFEDACVGRRGRKRKRKKEEEVTMRGRRQRFLFMSNLNDIYLKKDYFKCKLKI